MSRRSSLSLLIIMLFAGVDALGANTSGAQEHRYPIIENRKWGYIDRTGRVAIEPKFAFAEVFWEGLAGVNVGGRWGDYDIEGGTWGYIDVNGVTVIEPRYDSAGRFSEGLACVQVGDKYGYVDKAGTMVIRPQSDGPGRFSEGLAAVEVGVRSGFIDKSGELVIPLRYSSVRAFSDGRASVRLGSKRGYIDKTGEFIVDSTEFTFARPFSEGLACVRILGDYGYIDVSGEFAIIAQYDRASNFSEGLAYVQIEGRWSYIDRAGVKAFDIQCAEPSDFSEGLAVVKVDGKWGYINRKGEVVIKPQYEWAGGFRGGLAQVGSGPLPEGNWGYIDKAGAYVYRPKASPNIEEPGHYLPAPVVGRTYSFSLIGDSGERITADRLQGKVIVFDFWATDCGPCIADMAVLMNLYERHRSDGLEIIGVNVDKDRSDFDDFVSKNGIPWLHVYCGDEKSRTALKEAWGITTLSLPQYLILDRQGVLKSNTVRDDIEELVTALLKN